MLESTQELKQMELDFDFTYCLVYTEELKNFHIVMFGVTSV